MVRDVEDGDRAWVREVLAGAWAGTRVVVRGRSRDAAGLPGFVAVEDGRRVGLLTYDTGPTGLEVVTLNAVEPGIGAGTALLDGARRVAAEHGLTRVWLITTNDNVDALRFYQRRGMRITAVHPGGVDRGRLVKPAIPLDGKYGIEIHDEIELEATAAGVRIRDGAMTDIPAVLGLLDAATEWLVSLGRTGQRGTAPHSTNPRRLAAMAAWVSAGHLHVAEVGGRPAGALAVGTAPDYVPSVAGPELYVNLLVGSRAHRGIGGLLLGHARVLAVRRGLPLLRVDCYAGGDRALAGWYERQGFTATDPFTVGDWPGQVLQQRL
ncbi:GNAT family N-acetyltransferase [Dactylosporangium sp. CA-233914]|uniref:GNAT family N-acetyltransferase n=1 Tax=Dactylosporangium sp. CA-233914 TaxID=3239934 RepID=UPI003D9082A4